MHQLVEKFLAEIPRLEAGDTAAQAIRENLIRAFTAHLPQPDTTSATPVVGEPVEKNAPEPVDGPADTSAADSDSATAQPRRTWRQCPDLTPFLGTRENPLTDTDLQKVIADQTGYTHSLSAIQRRIWRMAGEGKVKVFTRDGRGYLIPYPAGCKHTPYVALTGADTATCQPAACAPEIPEQTNSGPVPAATCVGTDGNPLLGAPETQGGPLSSRPGALDTGASATRQVAAHGLPIAPDELLQWMRQHGVTKYIIHVEC